MTRINANIPPYKLIDQHLIAEYREIVRIPNAVMKDVAKAEKALQRAPNEFKLGTGHVLYFYDKIKFLHERFLELSDEMICRGFKCTMNDEMFYGIPDKFYKDCVLDEHNDTVYDRIIESIENMKGRPRYCGSEISLNAYKEIYANIDADMDF